MIGLMSPTAAREYFRHRNLAKYAEDDGVENICHSARW